MLSNAIASGDFGFALGTQQLADHGHVVPMAGRAPDDAPAQRPPEEREIAHDVENLVPHELVGEAQLAVDHTVLSDQDAVVEATAGRQARRRELREFLHEAERARRSDLVAERSRSAVLEDVVLSPDR